MNMAMTPATIPDVQYPSVAGPIVSVTQPPTNNKPALEIRYPIPAKDEYRVSPHCISWAANAGSVASIIP